MLTGWFQVFFMFNPTWGNDPIWQAYFSKGWFNHQLASNLDILNHIDGSSFICRHPSYPVLESWTFTGISSRIEASPKFPLLTTHQTTFLKWDVSFAKNQAYEKLPWTRGRFFNILVSTAIFLNTASWLTYINRSFEGWWFVYFLLILWMGEWDTLFFLGGEAWTSVFCLIWRLELQNWAVTAVTCKACRPLKVFTEVDNTDTLWSKYMAQSPKGGLVHGLYNPIHGDCAIYFYPGVIG